MGYSLQRSDPNAGRVLWRNRSERSARFARRLPGEADGRWKITDDAVEIGNRSAHQRRGGGAAKTIRTLDAGDRSHFAAAPGDQSDSRSQSTDQDSPISFRRRRKTQAGARGRGRSRSQNVRRRKGTDSGKHERLRGKSGIPERVERALRFVQPFY